MRLFIFACALLASLASPVLAQTNRLHGHLVDRSSKAPIAGAYVRLINLADTTDVRAGGSGDDGSFNFSGLSNHDYRLIAERIGYAALHQTITVDHADVDAGDLLIDEVAVPQEGIVVQGAVPAAVQKADTTEFSAQAVKTHRDATAEELVTKLPGVTIDNGTVKSNGEAVRQVLVDGKPYFGGDATLALRNLPADVVDKIQVYDKMSDLSEWTGFDDGQPVRTMNLSLRGLGLKANFGKVAVGHGDHDYYAVNGNETILRGANRLSLIAGSNNINQQNFSAQDLLGVLNTGGGQRGGGGFGAGEGRRFGGGAGGRGPGGGGQGGPGGGGGGAFGGGFGGAFGGSAAGPGGFLVGQQDGLSEIGSAGSNYSGALSKTLQANASYFFNRTDNNNGQVLARQYTPPLDSLYFYGQNSTTDTRNDNHRIDVRLEWNPDSSNSVVFQPRLYFQDNRSATALTGLNESSIGTDLSHADNVTSGTTQGNNLTSHLIARHKFAVRGRTVSLDLGASGTLRDNNGSLFSRVEYLQPAALGDTTDELTGLNTITRTLSARAVYTEPLGTHALLQLFASPSGTFSCSRSTGFLIDPLSGVYTTPDSALTNTFENTSIAQNGGAGVLMRRGLVNLMVNAAYQHSTLRSEQTVPRGAKVERTFDDVLPSMVLNINTADKRNLRVTYQASTRPPSVTQLQNVIDDSNPLILTTGNPQLKESVSHALMARYSRTQPAVSRSLFLTASVQRTANSIANDTYTAPTDTLLASGIFLRRGTQLVTPVNLQGNWNAGTFLTSSRPLKLLKSVLNLSGGVTWNRSPGIVAGNETVSNTVGLNPGLVVSSNISPDLDFTLTYNGTYNIARNTRQSGDAGDYYTHSLGFRVNATVLKTLVFRDEVSNSLTTRVTNGYDQNTVLWNTSVAKKFFKNNRGELKFGANDVLDQNRNTRRSVTESYIQDVRNRALGRTLLLAFTWTLSSVPAGGGGGGAR